MYIPEGISPTTVGYCEERQCYHFQHTGYFEIALSLHLWEVCTFRDHEELHAISKLIANIWKLLRK
jgi:hypothetical protein